jgi:hypothetical protein
MATLNATLTAYDTGALNQLISFKECAYDSTSSEIGLTVKQLVTVCVPF